MTSRFFQIAFSLLQLFLTFASVSYGQEPKANTASIDGINFELAEGLYIEKVADDSLIKWPMIVDWDSKGRLVVAESGGVASPIAEHNEKKLHKIVRLIDNDGDGKFDERLVAADKMDFPEGVLCLGDDILVCAPPMIWKLTDEDGDGVCEKRSVWFDGQSITYCANDLHGPFLGRDGWIYWCKGAFGKQTHQWTDGRKFESTAAHIFRRKLHGGPIEPIVSGGMDNPIEIAFTPDGEKFFISTFLQFPGNGLRDGIAHAAYGSVFGKDHEVVNNQWRTGDLMPVMTQLGAAAPSGIACLESDRLIQFETESQAFILAVAQFNLQKLSAHQLKPHGASYQSIDHDLVVADRIDFHPTDVLESGDGSLILVDTGGWYDLCCPTSRVDQKTASGGIYRISSDRSKANEKADGIEQSGENSQSGILDSRPWVRRNALIKAASNSSLAENFAGVMLENERPVNERLTALWALCHVGDQKSLDSIGRLLTNDNDISMVQAACHAISVHRSVAFLPQSELLLKHASLSVRRAAAEAIGRIGNANSIEKLLDAYEENHQDRHLEHSLLYALVEIAHRDSTSDLMKYATNDVRRRAAMLALDQSGRAAELDVSQVFDAVDSDNESLAATATEVLAGHPEWAANSAQQLDQMFAQKSESLAQIVSNWSADQAVQSLVLRWLKSAATTSQGDQGFLADNLARLSPAKLPPAWCDPIAAWISNTEPSTQLAIAASLRHLKFDVEESSKLCGALVNLAVGAQTIEDRLKILSALPKGAPLSKTELEQSVIDAFLGKDDARLSLASKVLDRIKLSSATHLVKALPDIAPQHLQTAIESVHRTETGESATQMLSTLTQTPAAKTLPRNFLTQLFVGSPAELMQRAKDVSEELARPPEDVQRAVAKKLAELADGDPVRGMQVFRGKKASCSACHKVGDFGTDVGPELTKIGASRTEEALLEAIMFPNARLEQSYRSTMVMTIDGELHNGLVGKEDGDRLTLVIGADRSVVVPKDEIEERRDSDISVMPGGLAEQLTPQELSDLIAFLKSAK